MTPSASAHSTAPPGTTTLPEARGEGARVIVTGIAGSICVLFTANDAYMRGFRTYAPADSIVSNTPDDNTHALRQIQVKGRTEPSPRLAFSRPGKRRSRR